VSRNKNDSVFLTVKGMRTLHNQNLTSNSLESKDWNKLNLFAKNLVNMNKSAFKEKGSFCYSAMLVAFVFIEIFIPNYGLIANYFSDG